MRTALVLLTLCIYAIYAPAQPSVVVTSTVSSQLPVFVNGDRLDPRDGVHELSLSRSAGVTVDGVLYLPISKTPPYVPSVRSDGMHYVCDAALREAGAVFDSTGDRSAAKNAMLEFWEREFGDSVVATQQGDWEFTVSYRGQSVMLSLACFDGYHPECLMPDNFEVLGVRYRELSDLLAKGNLVICGQGYVLEIRSNDAAQAIAEIDALKRNPPPYSMVGDQLLYGNVDLVGGRYRLLTSTVADLVGHR